MVHSHKEVRERAVQLTFDLYKLTPAEVRRELPPDTAALRKSVLWKTVMEGLDKIDGKPTVSMVRTFAHVAMEIVMGCCHIRTVKKKKKRQK